MKKTLVLLCAGLALACGAVEVDGIAAQVNGDAILKSDILLEMRRLNAPPAAYEDILREMIDRKLIVKAASASKMTMQEWVIEGRIREIIQKSFGGDRNKLMDTLAKQKISYPEWHQRMKDDMIVGAMRWNIIDKNIVASPSAMKEEFATNRAHYAIAPKATIAVILLKPEDAGKRTLVTAALKVKDFGDVARLYSADSHASEGGVWKDIAPREVFKPQVCDEIAKMPKGTISDWVEIDGWSFLLRKDDETAGREPSFVEAYDAIETNVRERLARAAYDAWVARLRAEAFIRVY